MKSPFIITALAFSLLLGTTASAQTTTSTDIKTRLGEFKSNLQLKREESNATVKANLDAKRLEMKADIEARRAEIKTDIETRRAEIKATIEAKRAELKTEVTEIRKEQALKRKGFVEQKLRQVIVVITAHQERVQNAIDRVKARGNVTTEAEASLAESKASLTIAVENLDKLKALTVEDTKQETVVIARGYAKAAEEALKKARASLVETIITLKKIAGTPKVETETTVETSAEATTN